MATVAHFSEQEKGDAYSFCITNVRDTFALFFGAKNYLAAQSDAHYPFRVSNTALMELKRRQSSCRLHDACREVLFVSLRITTVIDPRKTRSGFTLGSRSRYAAMASAGRLHTVAAQRG